MFARTRAFAVVAPSKTAVSGGGRAASSSGCPSRLIASPLTATPAAAVPVLRCGMHATGISRSSQLARAVEDYLASVTGASSRSASTATRAAGLGERSARLAKAVEEFQVSSTRAVNACNRAARAGHSRPAPAAAVNLMPGLAADAYISTSLHAQRVGARSAQLARAVESYHASIAPARPMPGRERTSGLDLAISASGLCAAGAVIAG